MRPSARASLVTCAVLLAASTGIAQNFPLHNWTVPPFDASLLTHGSDGGIHTLTHTQGDNPAVFVPFGPCRLTDTRVVAGGPGPIPASGTRNYDFVPSGCPFISGLQAAQDVSDPIIAWSLNISVVNTQGPGFLVAYPTGGAFPPVSVLNYNGTPGEVKNNAAIVPVNSSGSFSITAGVSGTDVIIDANGVFLNVLEPATYFHLLGNGQQVIWGENTRTDAFGTGVIGGHLGSGWGVYGYTNGTQNGTRGVFGAANGAFGYIFGVRGSTASSSVDAAGVKGSDGSGDPLGDTLDCGPCFVSGVRGVHGLSAYGYGVMGISRNGAGVAGFALNDTTTTSAAEGYLGTDFGVDPSGGGSIWAVFGRGDIGATGTKFFVEPHPTDASKVIRYISLEGAEAGTYFRGKGKFQNGIARIEVPEDFRLVTDSEGLSIQITPIGDMATVAVQSIGLEQIVVKGSRNVEFFYTVNGVRATFKDNHPIVAGREFAPQKEDATMPAYLSAGQKQLLIRNGTYKPDGTVNMETAHRLGWDRIWEARGSPQPQPVSDTP